MILASRLRITWLLLSLIFAVAPVTAKELEDRKWIEVSTENFRLWSTANKEKTTRIVRDLELLRQVVPRLTNVSRIDPAVPIHMFLMGKPADFRLFGLDKNYAGFYSGGLRRNTILIRETRGMDEGGIVQHEYTHFLLGNHSGLIYPHWFNEGFAEYLSGTEVKLDKYRVGYAPGYRWRELQTKVWLDPRRILDPKEFERLNDSKASMFYAQSWALIHMLINREDRDTSLQDEIQQYTQLTLSGTDEIDAFETTFGIPGGSINKRIRDHFDGRCCQVATWQIDDLIPDFSPKLRKLTRAEISLRLGQAAFKVGRDEQATRWFQIAAEDERMRPWAETGLGGVDMFIGDIDAAERHFETAAELAPHDPHVQLDLASFRLTQAEQADTWEQADDLVRKSRANVTRALELDDSIPAAHFLEGHVYLSEGEDFDASLKSFQKAAELYPSSIEIQGMLAVAYANAGDGENAVRVARSILAAGHTGNAYATTAREIIEYFEPNPDNNAE